MSTDIYSCVNCSKTNNNIKAITEIQNVRKKCECLFYIHEACILSWFKEHSGCPRCSVPIYLEHVINVCEYNPISYVNNNLISYVNNNPISYVNNKPIICLDNKSIRYRVQDTHYHTCITRLTILVIIIIIIVLVYNVL